MGVSPDKAQITRIWRCIRRSSLHEHHQGDEGGQRKGEAVHRLSDEFTDAHPEIDWHRIYGMRRHLVHGYDMFDAEIVWDAMQRCIPPLRAFCEQQVRAAEAY